MTSTSTCGTRAGEESFCSNMVGKRYCKGTTEAGKRKLCRRRERCTASGDNSHPPAHMLDGDPKTYWKSANGDKIVTITLFLSGTHYVHDTMALKFRSDPPRRIQLLSSWDFKRHLVTVAWLNFDNMTMTTFVEGVTTALFSGTRGGKCPPTV